MTSTDTYVYKAGTILLPNLNVRPLTSDITGG
jgi:hypothetical protein